MAIYYERPKPDELYHHGILGMKWGVRRFQNPDGSLTAAGKKRYQNDDGSLNDAGKKLISKQYSDAAKSGMDSVYKQGWKIQSSAGHIAEDRMEKDETYNKYLKEKYNYKNASIEEMNQEYAETWYAIRNFEMDKKLNEIYENDPNINKAISLCKQYNMDSWDELAKENTIKINEVKKAVELYDTLDTIDDIKTADKMISDDPNWWRKR